jgi:hypothetical protein
MSIATQACAHRLECCFESVTAWERYIKKHKAAIRLAMARGDLLDEATDKALYVDPALETTDRRRQGAAGQTKMANPTRLGGMHLFRP